MRHAVVGIGALNQVYRAHEPRRAKTFEPLSRRASEFETEQRSIYEFALKEYDKALKGMRQAIANEKHDVRTALVACLLVFCFESLQGNPSAAVSHAQSGLALLQHFMATKAPRCGMLYRSPIFAGIEPDILYAFSGLDTQILSFQDTRSVDIHRAAVLRMDFTVTNMPEVFETLEEAMSYWLMMQRRNCHFNFIAADAVSDLADSDRDKSPLHKPTLLDNDMEGADVYEEAFKGPLEHFDLTYKEDLMRQMLRYVEEIHRLTSASAPVFEQIERCGSKEKRVIMALLKIHINLNQIQLADTFETKPTEYDTHLPEYTTIVEQSEEIYPYLAQQKNAVYRFFLGIIYPLSVVGISCRNPHIRGRAINLLQRGPYREGIWDAMPVGHLTDWIRGVEEKCMDENGFIPENERAAMSLFDMDANVEKYCSGLYECWGRGDEIRERSDPAEALHWALI